MSSRSWIPYAALLVVFWGVWGAFSGLPTAEYGYPDEMVHAILAHYAPRTGVQPETLLDRTLYACDEITGLVTAAALVRPSKSVMDLEAKSVLKKMKDKGFAAGVGHGDVLVRTESQ